MDELFGRAPAEATNTRNSSMSFVGFMVDRLMIDGSS